MDDLDTVPAAHTDNYETATGSARDGHPRDTLGFVTEWRRANRCERDSDFAFCFADHHEAARISTFMASTWSRVKQEQMGDLPCLKARIISEIRSAPRTSTPPAPDSSPCTPGAPRTVKKRVISKQWSEKGEGITKKETNRMIHGIQKILETFVGQHERPDQVAVWSTRTATKIVAKVDRFTATKAINTFKEMSDYAKGMRKPVSALSCIDLDNFVDDSVAPVRSFTSLKWMSKNISNWSLDVAGIRNPGLSSQRGVGRAAGQAPVLEPQMVLLLDYEVMTAKVANSPNLPALVAAWAMVHGCVRWAHLQRSKLIKMTEEVCTFWCTKGKTVDKRKGFSWSMPRHTSSRTVDVGMIFMALSLEGKNRLFLVPTDSGLQLSMRSMVEVLRDVMSPYIEDTEILSSYSLRRVGPTWCDTVGLPWEERLAMGDWKAPNSGKGDKDNLLPARYSTSRHAASERVKLMMNFSFEELKSESNDSWEAINNIYSTEKLEEIRSRAADTIRSNQAVVWEDRPATSSFLSKRFKVSNTLNSLLMKNNLRRHGRRPNVTTGSSGPPRSIHHGTASDKMRSAKRCRSDSKRYMAKVDRGLKGAPDPSGDHPERPPASASSPSSASSASTAAPPKAPPPTAPLFKAPPPKAPPPKAPPPEAPRDAIPEEDEDQWDRFYDIEAGVFQAIPPSKVWQCERSSLWLGSAEDATGRWIRREGIGLIVSAMSYSIALGTGEVRSEICNIANPRKRDGVWHRILHDITNALESGKSVLMHCKAGRHRAATLTAITICYLKGCNFKTAEKDIKSVRSSVEITKAIRRSGWQEFVSVEEMAALQSRISAKFIQWKTHGEHRIHTMNHHSSTRSICGSAISSGESGMGMDDAIYYSKAFSCQYCAKCARMLPEACQQMLVVDIA